MEFTLVEREEELFQLWRRLPAPGFSFSCLRGERVVVIAHGMLNDGPGPDFRNALLLVNGHLRVADVEMHLRESDWFAHGHQNDPAYQSVALHVLAKAPSGNVLRLDIPTVTAQVLSDRALATSHDFEKDEGRGGESKEGSLLDLLTEFSWGRLLRRVTEILRDENASSPEERIERAFLIRLFDCLGYSRNRLPMKMVARQILSNRGHFQNADFDETAAMIFASCGIPAQRLEKVGKTFMSPERLRAVLPTVEPQGELPLWDFRGRPANSPERRLWGGAKLTFDLFRHNLLEELLEGIRRRREFENLLRPFLVRLGTETILGRSRGEEILVNALSPVAVAAGIIRQEIDLIEGACLTYRNGPGLASNRIVREVERRFSEGAKIEGAFLQQGAIEYYQRVLSPDRSTYSMIAERKSL